MAIDRSTTVTLADENFQCSLECVDLQEHVLVFKSHGRSSNNLGEGF